MKTISKHSLGAYILCFLLALAMMISAVGCSSQTSGASSDSSASAGVPYADGTVLGEGENQFSLLVTDKEGNETKLEIHTGQSTVGEALLELGVISGEDGPYGLYVKSVNGISADYDKDGVYWAFYINGEYATTGVDATEIVPDTEYALKVE